MGFYSAPGLPPVKNIVYVSKNENLGTQGFATITAALASITDNSVSNPYKIEVGPGTYIEDSLQMKSFVWIEGAGEDQTIIQSSLGNHVIIGADMAGLSKHLLTGATNSNQCAIYYASLTGTTNTAFYVEDCRFGENEYLSNADASTADTALFIENCKFGSIYPFDHGFLAENGGRIVIRNSTTTGLSAPFPDFVYKATGTNSEIVLNAVQTRSGTTTAGACIHLANGAKLRGLSTNIKGFAKGLFIENSGTGSIVDAVGMLMEDNTLDISVEHPDADGTFNGSADHSKIFVNTNSDFSVVISCNTTPSDGVGSATVGSILQGDRYDRLLNLSKLIREGTTLGAVSGGVISIDSGFNIEVDGGNGFLLDPTDEFVKEVTWSTTILTIPSNSIRYIYVDTNGVVQQAASLPSFETVIPLGRVSTNGTGIRFIEDTELDMQHIGNKIEAIFRQALGPVFISGAIVTQSGTRKLDVTAGSYFYGINILTLVGGTALTWQYIYRDGIGGWTEGSQSTVDNGFYDDGDGTLGPLSAGFYAKHSLYALGDGGGDKYYLVYSQNQYASLAAAEVAGLPTVPPYISDAVVHIADIIVKQGQSSIQEILDVRPRIGFSVAASTTGVSDHGSLTGLLDDDHPQYLLVSGTRAMTGNLDMGSQNITNVNLVDGVDVSAHASRHLPTGADPLTTGTPSSVSTANSEGIANAFARQDHVHDIAVNTVDNTRLADMATQTIKGRTTAGTGDPQDLTATQATAILNNFVGDSGSGGTKGLVPAPASGDAAASKFLKADGTWQVVTDTGITQLTGDVTAGPGSGSQVATIANDAVTNAKLANVATATFKGRTTAGTGDPEDLTVSQAKTLLNLTGTNSGDQTITLTGDVTGSGTGSFAATIATGAVTDTKASLATKPAVTVVATSNQTLSGTPTIDSQATAVGSIILLTAQTSGAENGPWVAAAGAWSRPTWYPSGGTTQSFQFITTLVRLGATYQGSTWRQTTAAPVTIDTTATTWVVTPFAVNDNTVTGMLPVDRGGTGQTTYTNGQLLIGNTSGNTLTKATLTAGAGISITNSTGSITVAATGLATSTDVQVFTGNGTWTKPSGAKAVDVIAVGGGGGGGSGSCTASGATAIGGAGGGGAVLIKKTYNASDLGSSVSVTVGAAGSAGTAVGPGASAGVSGGIGGTSTFGTILSAYGGGGGSQGVTSTSRSAGSGAGTAGAGGTGASAAVNGGLPNTGNGVGIAGGGGGVTGTNDVGQPSESGGGAGGGTTGSSAGQNGGTSVFSCGGGGGGGSTNTTTTPQAGGTGGGINTYITAGGGGGTAGTAAGGAGGTGTAGVYNGSGGGGGGASAANNTTAGGAGGAGGTYGGGGGGGGGCRSGGTAVSGAGGAGGAGVVIVITYF